MLLKAKIERKKKTKSMRPTYNPTEKKIET
jgi:hypothetical protein